MSDKHQHGHDICGVRFGACLARLRGLKVHELAPLIMRSRELCVLACVERKPVTQANELEADAQKSLCTPVPSTGLEHSSGFLLRNAAIKQKACI